MVFRWPIEIDGLPFLKMVDLSIAMLVITRWSPWNPELMCEKKRREVIKALRRCLGDFLWVG
jgi:hypothetical protein